MRSDQMSQSWRIFSSVSTNASVSSAARAKSKETLRRANVAVQKLREEFRALVEEPRDEARPAEAWVAPSDVVPLPA